MTLECLPAITCAVVQFVEEELREKEIRLWVGSLRESFGKPKPSVTIDTFQTLFSEGKYTDIVGIVRTDLKLTMRLRVGYVNSGGPEKAPAFIALPVSLPMYGTREFENTTIVVFIKKEFLSRASCGTLVVAIAHELAHIVLNAICHKYKHVEEVVDLTAMWLGYRGLFLEYSTYGHTEETEVISPSSFFEALKKCVSGKKTVRVTRTWSSLGYLTEEELRFAATLMEQQQN